MEDDEFVGCICCMGTDDLCDLFTVCQENTEPRETYAYLLETCFGVEVSNNLKLICSACVEQLEKAVVFKNKTVKSLSMIQLIKDEEYLDESILEEAELQLNNVEIQNGTGEYSEGDIKEEYEIQALDETSCIYCSMELLSADELNEHIRVFHEIDPRTGLSLQECDVCGITFTDPYEHNNKCHAVNSKDRQYPCHFCDNVYVSKKACFTHLRMKHGLKLCNEQTPKYVPRQRKQCHLCTKDFSQKQILNKHLLKAHGLEVEKRKAFICPLCDDRVSYGSHFSEHLLKMHRVTEQVEHLEFQDIDDFMLFKCAIQKETKYRFRKTTASKQTIEGIRSHYMCSQSGVYVYQGKGKRPAPERQIYKTGKACPAHMIVTQTTDRVLLTFYKTHVGHGPCPYFEPRSPKKLKTVSRSNIIDHGMNDDEKADDYGDVDAEGLICDTCGMVFIDVDKFRIHIATHGLELYPCRYCDDDFQSLDAWSAHVKLDHNVNVLF